MTRHDVLRDFVPASREVVFVFRLYAPAIDDGFHCMSPFTEVTSGQAEGCAFRLKRSLARFFTVSLLSWPQAAMMSRPRGVRDRKSTRLNSSHVKISY